MLGHQQQGFELYIYLWICFSNLPELDVSSQDRTKKRTKRLGVIVESLHGLFATFKKRLEDEGT